MSNKKQNNIWRTIFLVITGLLGFLFVGVLGLFIYGVLGSGHMFSKGDIFGLLAVSSVMFIVILALFLMAYFVYKDSKKRGMNPWLWLLIVVYAQPPIGFIIYLVVRQEKKVLGYCKSCGKQVENNFTVCPHCGTELKDRCPNCQKAIEDQWNVCPYCEAQLKIED